MEHYDESGDFQPDRAAGSDSAQRNSPHGALCGVMQNNIELAGASANNQIKWSERAHAIIPVDVSAGRWLITAACFQFAR